MLVRCLRVALLLGTTVLGGCFYGPYPYGPGYAYYRPHPHFFYGYP